MATRRRRFDRQFKLDALRMVQETEQPIAEIARNLGIHPNILYKWRNEFLSDAEHSFPGKGNLKPEDAELRALRRELETVKEERDILKKALAVFSRHGR